ncbi:SLAM family member 7-like isoform X2 [Toxotes jaculatrix]|uniref:SLAM family member 7-like isoform X2 n=1 Tax=Toxotes jaculatrix TaxID=941984 RepID=UPI001B3AC29F|nr:SLAM family member 7-like isoform X2 [Toxotes jaculatrix]
MDSIVLLFAVCLLRLWEAQGSSALTSVFVQKGKDLLLGVTEADLPTQINFLSWLFNRSDVLVTFSPDKEPIKYNERVEVFVGNYSIKLKNLQEADSGVYTVRAYGAKEHTETQYNVTVQDSVSPPQLIIDSVPTSSGSCNITVTCSTQDSHHINSTFTCDTQTCSQDIGEASKVTASGASLQVYLSSGSIICNHSNQVSWTTDMTINVCPQQLTGESENKQPVNSNTEFGFSPVLLFFSGNKNNEFYLLASMNC